MRFWATVSSVRSSGWSPSVLCVQKHSTETNMKSYSKSGMTCRNLAATQQLYSCTCCKTTCTCTLLILCSLAHTHPHPSARTTNHTMPCHAHNPTWFAPSAKRHSKVAMRSQGTTNQAASLRREVRARASYHLTAAWRRSLGLTFFPFPLSLLCASCTHGRQPSPILPLLPLMHL